MSLSLLCLGGNVTILVVLKYNFGCKIQFKCCVVSMTVGYILDTSLVTLLTSHIALSLTSHHRWGCDQDTGPGSGNTLPLVFQLTPGPHILSPAMTEHYWDLLLSSPASLWRLWPQWWLWCWGQMPGHNSVISVTGLTFLPIIHNVTS